MQTTSLTREQVNSAMNTAADRVMEAIKAPDTGTRDAINLVVNYACELLDDPDTSLDDAIASCYGESAPEVLSWAEDQ